MPHLTLEYTHNSVDSFDFEPLFSHLHSLLSEVANADIGSCKSRAIKIENYFIGDGADHHAFVHLNISLLAGRSQTAKQQLGEAALALLEQYFYSDSSALKIQATVKITDMPIELYFKSQFGSPAKP